MGRPYVPHCRKCSYAKSSFSGHIMCKLLKRYPKYQELKTSPKDCPRRLTYNPIGKGY